MPVREPCPLRLDGEIVFKDLAPPALERLRLRLSLPNPSYVALKRFHGFAGAEPPTIESLIEMPDGSVHLPRGCVDLVREQLGRCDLVPRMREDRRSRGTPIIAWHRPKLAELRDYQDEAIRMLTQRGQGLVILPCGCGKTKLGVGAILRYLITTLVLVHTTDLADQWIGELAAAGIDAGLVGDGKCEDERDVVVGIVDTIVPMLETRPRWGERFGFVILDEAHHAPAATFQRALRRLPAYYRLGLTATPEREDGLSRLVEWSFGDVLLERTTREMIALGYLSTCEIVTVSTGFTFEYDGPEKKYLAALDKAVAGDLLRNALIADTVAKEALAGETCLVLVREREHARELAEMIAARGVEARALTGKTAKRKRRATVADLREGRLPVACATSLADEGLDLPRLSVIALAAPARAKGATTQRLGRLLRKWEGKKPKLIDFIDDDVDTLASRATARRKVYLEAGLLRPAA